MTIPPSRLPTADRTAAHPAAAAVRAPPTDSATLRVEISELVRLHWHSVAGLRRESTMLRKELAVSNNIIRTLVKKTNDIASIADQLAVSFIHN